MKTRSTFRRRKNGPNNAVVFGYRAAFRHAVTRRQRQVVENGFHFAHAIARNAPKNLPGETNRQLAARLRAETATTESPARQKRVRTKKVAA